MRYAVNTLVKRLSFLAQGIVFVWTMAAAALAAVATL
jgi:hypothetical protein